MKARRISKLDSKKRYLQVALNSTLDEAYKIISQLPVSDRILVEAGTPLIKRYGVQGIRQIKTWCEQHALGNVFANAIPTAASFLSPFLQALITEQGASIPKIKPPHSPSFKQSGSGIFSPYVVADLKTMDRGETEVEIAYEGGASGAIALGSSPVETLNSFISQCESYNMDAMIDMMNVEFPLAVLRALKKIPRVVILHRGVDEERFNHEKQIPLHEIRRIKGNYNIMISIAGGDTLREVQRSIFNDADIVVVWKSVYQSAGDTGEIVSGFLKAIK